MQKLPRKEREEVMELTTSWKEEGIQIGLQQGLQQGLQRETELVLRQLKKRLGALNEQAEKRLRHCQSKKLKNLERLCLISKTQTI
jgi:flagellar biosynthesis/type III secretory pathway protein FliH